MKRLFLPLLILLIVSCQKNQLEIAQSEFINSVKPKMLDPESFKLLKFEIKDTIYKHSDESIIKYLKKLTINPNHEYFKEIINYNINNRDKNKPLFHQIADSFDNKFEGRKFSIFFMTPKFSKEINFHTPNKEVTIILENYIAKNFKSNTILGYEAYSTFKSTNKQGLKGITEVIVGIDDKLKIQSIQDTDGKIIL